VARGLAPETIIAICKAARLAEHPAPDKDPVRSSRRESASGH
jgi:hypothetical protein